MADVATVDEKNGRTKEYAFPQFTSNDSCHSKNKNNLEKLSATHIKIQRYTA